MTSPRTNVKKPRVSLEEAKAILRTEREDQERWALANTIVSLHAALSAYEQSAPISGDPAERWVVMARRFPYSVPSPCRSDGEVVYYLSKEAAENAAARFRRMTSNMAGGGPHYYAERA